MHVIGLTGSIGSGKSHVSSVLASLGAYIVDGDQISHELTAPHGKALPAIRQVFGEDVFFPDGTLNRKALGNLVFASDHARLQLNSLIQPMILKEIQNEMSLAEAEGRKVCVLDMPLLFEEHLDRLCDRVWCVYLPENLQIQRIMERDRCTQSEAISRIRSQMDATEKAARADVVIDTSGSFEETNHQVSGHYQYELALSVRKGDAEHAGTSCPAPSL